MGNELKKQKIIFIHGLESKPVGEKIEWLSGKCELLALEIDSRLGDGYVLGCR